MASVLTEIRQRFESFLWFSILLVAAAALSACGGGGSSSGSGSAPATPARSLGEITEKGSIFVNGVEFETAGAELEFENEAPETIGADDSKLMAGMIVEVDGKTNSNGTTGNAERIKFDDNVRGPITAVTGDDNVKVVTIMGQEVVFEDNLTKFDPASGMPIGDDINKVFSVSGFERDDTRLQATFAAEVADGGILEVEGVVSNLDNNANTFMINGLTVDFAGALQRDLPTGLANGLLVEVKGTTFDAATVTLTATEIEGKVQGLGDDIAEAEVEGFIADLDTGAKTFQVSGQLVDYALADFLGGIEADLANGIKVEAEGPLSGGVLLAEKVVFKESLRFEANVASKVGNVLTLEGLSGISIRIDDALTRGSADLALIEAGDGVKIRARQGAGGLVATRLEEIAPVDRIILQGPVDSFSLAEDRVTILGIDVNTATIEAAEFKDNDTVIGKAAFFAALKAGSLVKARFDLTQGAGEWDQIEFED